MFDLLSIIPLDFLETGRKLSRFVSSVKGQLVTKNDYNGCSRWQNKTQA